jgi:CO/xanthine dehydrogenase FAD-binding subunit
MQDITFHRPETLDAACELLGEHGHDVAVLAGGQSLVQMLKQRLVNADHVLDITAIPELDGITAGDDALHVGAAVTYERVREHLTVEERVPALREALGTVGDVQIRSRGTLAGGIAHADPQGDPPVIASALDAILHITGPHGSRTVPAEEFFRGLFDTALEPDELIEAVEVPYLPETAYSTYNAFAPREGDYAIASLALVLDFDDGRVSDATLTVGSVGDVPTRLTAAEDTLVGERLTEDRCGQAAAVARETVDAFGDDMGSAEYKEALVERLVRDSLGDALDANTGETRQQG